jgi:hypothetical protein
LPQKRVFTCTSTFTHDLGERSRKNSLQIIESVNMNIFAVEHVSVCALDHGLVLGPGSWAVCFGDWALRLVVWVLGFGSWLSTGLWVLGLVLWPLGLVLWSMGFESWFDAKHWVRSLVLWPLRVWLLLGHWALVVCFGVWVFGLVVWALGF